MIQIDGSYGEGGGQVLRSSLALSMVTGIPFQIKNIRSGRKKPGLMRQHLTAANAAAEICDGEVKGNRIGSTDLFFSPGRVKPGSYHFAVGTAGSCTLVFQTILPALLLLKGPSQITLEGGTHNPYAPPFDFLDRVFLPLVSRMGPKVSARLMRPGFYPAGGGKFEVDIEPDIMLKPLDLSETGRPIYRKACARTARLPINISHREIKVVRRILGWHREELFTEEIKNSKGPGNILTLELAYENISEVFTGFGERGVPAETVAKRTAKLLNEYLSAGVPVGKYLADQILIPMALAGTGSFITLAPTRHTITNAEILKKFLDVRISMNRLDEKKWEFRIS